ncbi:Bcies1 [Botrytis cinerea B05.10]|uniref:Bcies1 n=1 Tax=Botryotinia fuckeliana (strain B05.10) TaxID=332648 RepID=A0A384JHB9_BOTFB|nr:Bcies1 [Botrytis cinerea B05.10]ATZ49979.1 Bcies1 [Botrytis cinerea B05.10]
MADLQDPVVTVASDKEDVSPTRSNSKASPSKNVTTNTNSPQNTPSATTKPTNDLATEDEERRTPIPDNTSATPAGNTSSRSRNKSAKDQPSTMQGNLGPQNNKVRHLKKDDGEPLWRKDIQYDFLKLIFEDDNAVFTNGYDDTLPKQTFADLYIDTMARSSKTSKILRDKLLSEHEPAKNMAMVCLLVNLGRMNTTLNFFPEMRAQLRTYHAIPSLQARQDPNSYKQLQDAPRLKSILKGASEDRPEPGTLEKIKSTPIPRTNPVNLIFVLTNHATKVTELHFPTTREFYDLIMNTQITSKSRAKAFLWLMWFYLESDFTEEGADENPFGSGVDYDTDVRNQGVPRLQDMTEEEEALENVDTEEELEYGHTKMRERKRIIEADQIAFQAENGPPKRGPKPKLNLPLDEASNSSTIMSRVRPRYDDVVGTPASLISSRYRGGKNGEGSSPAPEVPATLSRRHRPLTAHQIAVERNRNQRVDYILSRGIRKAHHSARKLRKQQGVFARAYQRVNAMSDPFSDSEDDTYHRNPYPFKERGFGGLVQLEAEEDDFGEEVSAYAAAFRRAGRRLDRWDGQKGLNLGVIGTNRILTSNGINGHRARDSDETEDEPEETVILNPKRQANGHVTVQEGGDDDLDDMDKELLGLVSDDDEDGLDPMEKSLLGIGGDETEIEASDTGMDVD